VRNFRTDAGFELARLPRARKRRAVSSPAYRWSLMIMGGEEVSGGGAAGSFDCRIAHPLFEIRQF